MFGRSFIWFPRRAWYGGYSHTDVTNGWIWLRQCYWEWRTDHYMYFPDK